ncbi:MAG TPA: helix-turn-helix domain-containing protein [Nocardioidaceae bacterium]|nr:helix-turn-helix domain-containing protein [Nocardioidaceae bacterium]
MTAERRPADGPAHDPTVLRAIAHPLRTRILDEVTARGTARAADLAHALNIPANQASFHLRQLAKYGLIEEAPEEARDRRDRVWRPTSPEGLRLDLEELRKQPGGQAAVSVWQRQASAWAHRLVDEAHFGARLADTEVVIQDGQLRLTKAQAIQLSEELDGVLKAWRRRIGPGEGDARTYSIYLMLQPYPEAQPDLEDAEGDDAEH